MAGVSCRASSASCCSPVALIMTNGNDGISSPRQASDVSHSTPLHHLTEKPVCLVASRYFYYHFFLYAYQTHMNLDTHTHTQTHASQFFSTTFFSSLHLVLFFFFSFSLLNSSLFSAHVYFYLSVPREESEK